VILQFNCQLIDVDSSNEQEIFKKISRSKKKQDQALVSFCQLTPSQCLNLLFYATKFNYGTGCLARAASIFFI
jgi:hypothetical protein